MVSTYRPFIIIILHNRGRRRAGGAGDISLGNKAPLSPLAGERHATPIVINL